MDALAEITLFFKLFMGWFSLMCNHVTWRNCALIESIVCGYRLHVIILGL